MKKLNDYTVSFLYILWLKGGKEKEVAEKVGISQSTVYKYFLDFRQNKNTLQGHYSLHSGNYQYYEREEEIFKSINPEYNPEDLQGWELEQFLKDTPQKNVTNLKSWKSLRKNGYTLSGKQIFVKKNTTP